MEKNLKKSHCHESDSCIKFKSCRVRNDLVFANFVRYEFVISFGQAPSSRRSHDGGYGGDSYSSGNASRYESSQSYSDRRSFGDDRRPAFRSRDDYRKPVSLPSGSSVRQSPRGGYRGRVSSRRGARASRIGLRDGIIRRRVVDSGFRKRGATLRSTSDYLRRLKISRLRR